ncbi:MAG: class I SAM-dependent methyltransferase, partial [Blautia sp.]|nr:class I SAM-dependent methyltransferase [Blautia sp.]
MKDNRSAFSSDEYDKKIKQTIPYYEEFYAQTIELVRTLGDGARTWLDVGCGTGKMGSAVFEKGVPVDRFVFCDSSEEMIRVAQERFSSVPAEFCICDVLDLPFKDEFDVVTAIQVFHYFHLEERKRALKRCYDALKENGVFISFENFAPFTETGKVTYLEKWKRFQMTQGKTEEEAGRHI